MKREEQEIWKDIPDYIGYYQVSNFGNVKSLERQRTVIKGTVKERILRLNFDSSGYRTVKLYKDGVKKSPKVHRLVCNCFVDNPNNLPEINHKNAIKTDNRPENLEWCTRQENMNHANDTGLRDHIYGENHSRAKLTIKDVIYIKNCLLKNSVPQQTLAEKFGVTYCTINGIKYNRTWKKVLV